MSTFSIVKKVVEISKKNISKTFLKIFLESMEWVMKYIQNLKIKYFWEGIGHLQKRFCATFYDTS